jgi:DNA-binding winged helix-turn-helix (wHTH) protein
VNYDFAGFRLDAAKRQLIGIDGSTIHLPSRAYDVLLYMAERPGEMLEKSALLQAGGRKPWSRKTT